MQVKGFKPLSKNILGWNGDSPVFSELIREVMPLNIIEVGSWYGMSTITMAKESDAKIHCVDTWLGSLEFVEMAKREDGHKWDRMLKHGYPQVYYQFLSNIIHEGVVEKIEVYPMTSENALPHLPEAELIYIDAQHTYKGVKEDVENYWTKLKKGGVMFGDDYYMQAYYQPEVKRAVDEFADNHQLPVEVAYNNFWILRK